MTGKKPNHDLRLKNNGTYIIVFRTVARRGVGDRGTAKGGEIWTSR
jgi:hypothetical protein